jgi:hypothetical protein
VEELLGSGGAEAAWSLAGALVRREAAEALQRIADAAASGLDLALLCEETMELLRRALLVAVTGSPGPDATQDETARLTALGAAAGAGEPDLLLLLRGLLDADTEMRKSPHPRVDLEIAVVRLCHRPQTALIETVLERLEQAEARLRGYGGAAEAPAPVQSDLLGGAPEPAPPRPVVVPRPVERAPAPPPPPPRSSVSREPPPPPVREAPPAARPAPMAPAMARSATEAWSAIVAEVIRVRPTLGHLLSEGVVVGEEDGRLAVSVPNGSAFVNDQLKKAENRELVLEAARRLRPGLRDVAFTTGAGPGGVPGRDAPRGAGRDGAVRGRDHPGPCRSRAARQRARESGGRRRGGPMKGFGNLVKEAQKLQAQLEALKEEVGKKKVEASAGGGMVVVRGQRQSGARVDQDRPRGGDAGRSADAGGPGARRGQRGPAERPGSWSPARWRA